MRDSPALPGFCDVTVGDSQAEFPVDVLETSELFGRLLVVLTVLDFTDHTANVTRKETISYISETFPIFYVRSTVVTVV